MILAKYTSIGGQALIEGIMMKNPQKKTALAVRKPDKTIDISFINDKSIKDKYPILKLPIIRGLVTYIETMIQGYKAMMKSADISGFTDIEEENDKPKDPKKESAVTAVIMTIGSVLGIALAVILFLGVPRYAVAGLEWLIGSPFSKVVRSGIEQLIKLAVLVAYMWGVSFMKDIRRVFSYHGAEHKTIFCYEAGLELTVENVKKQKRFHPRCGTSFLILMILVSMIVSTVVQMIFPTVYDIAWLWIIAKVLMLPVICGLGYEVLKICGKYDNILTRIISAPGVWMQHITTKEPDDDMIEVAIAALKACDEIEDNTQEETQEDDNI
ncbi:MAG: DUF1385 domain-containing protein [Clostridia bacterium]|nr:DUF1385 domain-containing protein [Clostridia bacterium]